MTARELASVYVRLLAATSCACAMASIVARCFIWNWTPSLPLGLYWLSRGSLAAPGQLVAFPIPTELQDLVHERRYLPPGAVLVKPVVATAGDWVCTRGGSLSVNGRDLGAVLTEDSARRPLPHYEGCGPLAAGEIFVASHFAKSFDSRTFGPIRALGIRGTVTPLWTY